MDKHHVFAALALLLTLVMSGGAQAQTGFNFAGFCQGIQIKFQPTAGFQQITVSTTAVGLTVPQGALFAVVEIESNAIRYRDDGTDPTASVGMLVNASTVPITVCNPNQKFKMIRQGAADATASVSYYGIKP